jgi:hypothetical protein
MTPGPGKSRFRERAIEGLLSGYSIKRAAEGAGICERTLQRWLAEPGFSSEYAAAKSQLLDGTINRLRSSGIIGVEALRRVAIDKQAPAAATVSAGRAILEVLLRATEIQDFAAKLSELERLVAERDR